MEHEREESLVGSRDVALRITVESKHVLYVQTVTWGEGEQKAVLLTRLNRLHRCFFLFGDQTVSSVMWPAGVQ